jgi:hypothetical protein
MDEAIEGMAGALVDPFAIQPFVVPGQDTPSFPVKGETKCIVFDHGVFTQVSPWLPFDQFCAGDDRVPKTGYLYRFQPKLFLTCHSVYVGGKSGMIGGHPILEVPARGDILGHPSGRGYFLRDDTSDPARPGQWVKQEQLSGLCPLHVLAQLCQRIALKEQAQAPRRVSVTGLVVPLRRRIFRAWRPDGTIRAPGMFIP